MTPSVYLIPMSAEQFVAYRVAGEQSYAESISASALMPVSEARVKATEDFSRLLPDGRDTEGQHFWMAFDGDQEVGMLWLALTEKSDGLHAFGYDFLVPEELRRQGYGRAIMVATEQLCREKGVVSVGLSVFGFNDGARALYEEMGFEVTMLQMTKRL